MAEVLEGPGQGQVVGLRGRGQDVVHPLGSLYREYRGGAAQSEHSESERWVTHWESAGGERWAMWAERRVGRETGRRPFAPERRRRRRLREVRVRF